jgi:hypothetical protein
MKMEFTLKAVCGGGVCTARVEIGAVATVVEGDDA